MRTTVVNPNISCIIPPHSIPNTDQMHFVNNNTGNNVYIVCARSMESDVLSHYIP